MRPSSRKKKDEQKIPSVQDRSSPKITGKKAAFEDLHGRISRRAYELYVQRGCRHGHALDDWLEAEREILDQ